MLKWTSPSWGFCPYVPVTTYLSLCFFIASINTPPTEISQNLEHYLLYAIRLKFNYKLKCALFSPCPDAPMMRIRFLRGIKLNWPLSMPDASLSFSDIMHVTPSGIGQYMFRTVSNGEIALSFLKLLSKHPPYKMILTKLQIALLYL